MKSKIALQLRQVTSDLKSNEMLDEVYSDNLLQPQAIESNDSNPQDFYLKIEDKETSFKAIFDVRWVDQGIGMYEYWGSVERDVRMAPEVNQIKVTSAGDTGYTVKQLEDLLDYLDGKEYFTFIEPTEDYPYPD